MRGLPQNRVNDIVQDKEGFVWFAMLDGVYRFDGNSARHFELENRHTSFEISSPPAFGLFVDELGRLWVGTLFGLVHLDRFSGEARLYQPVPNRPNPSNIIKSITQDHKGFLWLGSENGLIKFDPEEENFEFFYPDHTMRFPDANFDGDGNIWGVLPDAVYQFDIESAQFQKIDVLGNNGVYNPTALYLDEKGKMFIKVKGEGIFQKKIGSNTGEFERLLLSDPLFDDIYHICASENWLFLSSAKGLQKLDLPTGKVTTHYPSRNPIAYFDGDKLEKIITNLLSNAFKYTPEDGEIQFSALIKHDTQIPLPPWWDKVTEMSGNLEWLEIVVEDKGTGIPSEMLPRIFDRFYQVETNEGLYKGGSGIGLALVKELVELYGGTIQVNSRMGKGCSFRVRLPVFTTGMEEMSLFKISTQSVEEMKINPSDDFGEKGPINGRLDGESERPLVLVVEDNQDIRDFIRDSINVHYSVREAENGKQGLDMALHLIPDLVISDLMMPLMDGISLSKTLKEEEKTAHIPIILLTAKASGESKMKGLQTGADDYITKPFEAEELMVRVKNLIDNRQKLKERFSQEILLQPMSKPIRSLDGKFLEKSLVIIEKYMDDTLFGVERFSMEVGMSRMQLHRKIKGVTGYAPGDLIRLIRLKRSAELLESGAGNIAEVACMVGFQDPSHFAKCFYKQFGKTPSEFLASCSIKDPDLKGLF